MSKASMLELAQSSVRVEVGKLSGQLTHGLVANSYDNEKVLTE